MARYSKDFISEIKGRLKVSEVVQRSVKLTQRGSEFVEPAEGNGESFAPAQRDRGAQGLFLAIDEAEPF